MPTNPAVTLALAALQAILQVVAELKAQLGMTDDEILAHAQQLTAGNDTAYAALKAALIPAA